MALGILLSRRVWRSSTAHLTWSSQKTVGDREKLLTYLNSALKVLLETDIFPHVPFIHSFFTFNLAVTKKIVGDEEKLFTYLNSALKVLLGTDIFLCVPKKS
jgi:hypothetical protein